MQDVYQYIQKCDNILIASPLYFSELTGKLLDVGSRLQTYFCARFFRNEEPIAKSKKGAVILVGGGGPALIVKWLRNKNTIEFLGIWEEMRDKNPDKKGNIRDYASINELICLSEDGDEINIDSDIKIETIAFDAEENICIPLLKFAS